MTNDKQDENISEVNSLWKKCLLAQANGSRLNAFLILIAKVKSEISTSVKCIFKALKVLSGDPLVVMVEQQAGGIQLLA
ncbi:hypothetical protein yfred0001_34810 [Yersinia frederiksenii ATCC 33641]|nr:hypothetical protein [Yersinia frederiksenii]EEQ13457.1 hypothetical protein yfred0001_34810 [Yersinia frederiksenii ATCC 33641]